MDAEEPGDVRCRAACVQHGEDLGLLLGRELGLPAAVAALGACGAQARLGSFAHHGALELGESAEHLHHHAAGSRGAVYVFGERAESGAGLFDLVEDEQQVLERARQAIEFPDGEDIAGLEPVKQAMEFRPIPAATRDAFLVDALAACGFEGLDLGGGILVFGLGHAGVAEQDGRCCILAGCEFQAPQKGLRLINVYAISFMP
jgi:hypothetical protein